MMKIYPHFVVKETHSQRDYIIDSRSQGWYVVDLGFELRHQEWRNLSSFPLHVLNIFFCDLLRGASSTNKNKHSILSMNV